MIVDVIRLRRMRYILLILFCVSLAACSKSSVSEHEMSIDDTDQLVRVFPASERKATGAYFWDWLRDDLPAWKGLEYQWIGSSVFGDQIIVTSNSPIHSGTAVYLHGPDIHGPKSNVENWPENMIYLGASVETWLNRIKQFGDEHSIAPPLDDSINNADE